MRIRLTLDIERRRPDPEPILAEREVRLDALVEHAVPHRIGFHAEPGRVDPFEYDDRARPPGRVPRG